MTDNEIIIYGFQLGNSDPDFKAFVRSLSNTDVLNLRKILYESKLDKYRDGYGAAMYGRDRYGCVDIPNSIRVKKWEESDKELFSFIKDIWVASVLGFDDPGLNPIKNYQWRITRIRAVTSHGEALPIIAGVVIEIALSYVGARVIGVPKIRVLKDVGYKTIQKRLLERLDLDLSKEYWSGFKVYNESQVFMRVQIHRHTIQKLTKNSKRYPHLNIEIINRFDKKVPFSNRHIILDREYYYHKIKKQWRQK